MRPFHRSKWAGCHGGPAATVLPALAVLVVAVGCRRAPDVTTRTVTAHVVCSPAGATLDGNADALYYGLGDFDPTAPVGGRVFGGDVGATLSEIDPRARSLWIDATETGRQWWGITAIGESGDVDVLMVPALTSCALGGTPAAVPARTAAVLGEVSPSQALVVGGVASGPGSPAATLVVDLDRGSVAPVTEDRDLRTPRIRASVTSFGSGSLVAGGVDPGMAGAALGTAEIYDPAIGGFDQQAPIFLSQPRADQGAVVLASGVTLLVGGVGADAATVLASMEIVDPATRTVRAENVASLAVARRLPTVLRLASGDVLVAGGVDGAGNSVTTMELFAPDASQRLAAAEEPVSGGARAYATLPAGGALFVVAPAATGALAAQNAWFFADPAGTFEAAAPITGPLSAPVFFGGAGDAPALWTGDRWLRWQPWNGAFGALGSLDDVPAQIGGAVLSPDPGLAMWLDTSQPSATTVTAMRFDTRGDYSTLDAPLLVEDMDDVAPDRLPVAGTYAFDPTTGLTLSPGASAFVTDCTYEDVTIDLDMDGAAPASIVLRDPEGVELVVGGPACPGPPPASGAANLEVVRTGATVTWTFGAGGSGTCATGFDPGARVSIGVRGGTAGATPSVVRNWRITRTAAP